MNKRAEGVYGAKHAEVEAMFARWRQDDAEPIGSSQSHPPLNPNVVSLTPALLRRLADAHYLNVYEDDFLWRGDLWEKVHPCRRSRLSTHKQSSSTSVLCYGSLPPRGMRRCRTIYLRGGAIPPFKSAGRHGLVSIGQ